MGKDKLVIVGDGESAEMAYEYFSQDYDIKAFLTEKKYLKKRELFGLPVKALEDLETDFPRTDYGVFVAISFVDNNKLRERLYQIVLDKGYQCVSYIHPSVSLGAGSSIGENCFILENVVLQRKVRIENNVFIWSGSVIAHQSKVCDHAFIASGVMVSGFCVVGKRSFLGVGSKIKDYIHIAEDTVVGGGAFINKDTEKQKTYVGVPGKEIKRVKR